MRLLDHCSRDDSSVLEHVFKVYKVAVVHVLSEIVGIMEMDNAFLMCFNDLCRKKYTFCKVTADFAGHIVTLR